MRNSILLGALVFIVACERSQPSDSSAVTVTPTVPTTLEQTPTGHVPLLSAEFAKAFFDQKKAVFIDVRGSEAFNVEHIQGALDLSLKEIQSGLTPEGPKDQLIVTYCACPHSMSSQAAAILIRKGYSSVYVLDEGFLYWKEKGWPMGGNADPAKPLRKMTIRGQAPGVAEGSIVQAQHVASEQLETGEVKTGGHFELHLPFYGIADGEPIRLSVAGRELLLNFSSAGTDVVLPAIKAVAP